MPGLRRKLTTRVPVHLAKRLDQVAMRLGLSAGSAIQEALEEWLSVEERRHAQLLEAMASIDAGNYIEHAEIVAWATSLDTEKPLPTPVAEKRRVPEGEVK